MIRNLPDHSLHSAFKYFIPQIYKNKLTVGIRVPAINSSGRSWHNLASGIEYIRKRHNDEMEFTTIRMIHEKWGEIADFVIVGGFGGVEPSTVGRVYF
jgi:hypothetical protein